MRPTPTNLGEAMLARMDRWTERSQWLPQSDEWFPGKVFWGIFLWNFPILLISTAIIGLVLYRSDPETSTTGFFTAWDWRLELAAEASLLATSVDLTGCLYLRRLWNRRARWIRSMDAQDA